MKKKNLEYRIKHGPKSISNSEAKKISLNPLAIFSSSS